MKILHYALGFPPYRTGGLTKYCMDLMLGQKEQGHDTALLWPGKMSFISNTLSIHKDKDVDGVQNFEIINPLPVALDEGIIDITAYITSCNKEVYREFLERCKPNAIHIHTLMGLHKEFLMVAKELKIKTVFTTHDYYGLCPKVTLFYNGQTCDDDNECQNCVECNHTALTIKKIMIMQSPLYRRLKNSAAIKLLRRKHRREFFNDDLENASIVEKILDPIAEVEFQKKAKEYRQLRQYYVDMYQSIDIIHFNSSVAEMVYKRYFDPKNCRVINISHGGISDHRKKKKFTQKLKITYLGPIKPFKGFNILKVALDELWEEGHRDFELNIFNITNQVSPYMNINEGYDYNELEGIFDKTDVLISPSVWYETFGFTVLEALSYGVPVIVSENVGAKDLLCDEYGDVIHASVADLKEKIAEVLTNRNRLIYKNEKICSTMNVLTMEQFLDYMYRGLYDEI